MDMMMSASLSGWESLGGTSIPILSPPIPEERPTARLQAKFLSTHPTPSHESRAASHHRAGGNHGPPSAPRRVATPNQYVRAPLAGGPQVVLAYFRGIAHRSP